MRYLLAIALVAVLAGCGSASKPAAAPRGHAVAARAAELVNYQRNGGLAATLDTVSVRTDGSDARRQALRRRGPAVRRLPPERAGHGAPARGARPPARPHRPPSATACARAPPTSLRYRGRTYVARQGAVPAALRPAVATLDAIADGGGRGGPVHHVTQAPA